MVLYIIISLILWFVVPLFIEGHVKKRTDRKAFSMLSRIIAITLVLLAIYRFLSYEYLRKDICRWNICKRQVESYVLVVCVL